jgi:hypothetical protein
MIGFACSNSPIDEEWNHIRFEYFNRETSRLSCSNKFLRPRIPRLIFALNNEAICRRVQKTGMKTILYEAIQIFFNIVRDSATLNKEIESGVRRTAGQHRSVNQTQNFRDYGRESLTEMQAIAHRSPPRFIAAIPAKPRLARFAHHPVYYCRT